MKHSNFQCPEMFLEVSNKLQEVCKVHVQQAKRQFQIKFCVEVPKIMRKGLYLMLVMAHSCGERPFRRS